MCDNCPTVTNEHQTDIDNDSGDACDVCPTIPNESQGDDQDKIGDFVTIVLFQQMPINLMETATTLGMLATIAETFQMKPKSIKMATVLEIRVTPVLNSLIEIK